jgi:hypothetical protein
MRRAIAATVMGGLLLGGAVATPAVAAARGDGNVPGKARSAAPAKPPAAGKAGPSRVGRAATSKATTTGKAVTGKPESKKAGRAMKTVAYAGYEFQVPASWPVYRLDEHPRTCVRYDVHAVYLGRPGPDMRCAAGLIGRTQTVSLIPGRGVPNDTVLQRVAAVHAAITQNAVNHELKVALGPSRPSATVLGTYGSDPAVVQQVLNTLRLAPAGTAPTGQSPSAPPAGTAAEASRRANLSEKAARLAPQRASASTASAPSKQPMGEPVPPNPTSTSWPGLPANWPVEVVQPTPAPAPPSPPKPSPGPFHPVSGFDTCTAPSTSAMRAWRSQYAAVGVYIGGVNAACAYGNLSAGWVKSAASMGWGLLPTYVGPQAPCWGAGSGVLISPGSAVAQGSAAALDAVGDARALGLPAGSPIYYDMEAYNGGSSCTNAVLRFLGAWDRLVQAAGYVSAVYSSQDSGIVDMQSGAVKKTPGFTPPNAIWIALWDNVASLNDGTLTWPLSARSKQYAGSVNATIGGVTLNIDRDFVGGPLAHLPSGDRRAGEAGGSRPNQFARTAVDS